ncbi:MAG: GxxExxY protein [Chloroflexi bacterium]|nr:GxxExxY protein [Chloroflexota bacterium]MBI2759650.1 GxxExxY protein [Chloroflexota bacterium]
MAETDLNKITEKIIACAYDVSNTLGIGFVEKVYENAHSHEMKKNGLHVARQYPIKVIYDGVVVGEFFADMLVENLILVELKAVTELNDDHMAQALNYLRATGLPACLLINFGKSRLQIRRLHPSPSWKIAKL